MLRLIELNKKGIGRLANREPFLVPDDLTLQFVADGYNLENAFITLINGDVVQKHKLTNPFEVDKELLKGGMLSIVVKAYEKEIAVKTWAVMPLIIKETETGKEVQDYVFGLENRIIRLEEDVKTLKKQHQIIK